MIKKYVVYEMQGKVFSCYGMDSSKNWTEEIKKAIMYFYKEDAEHLLKILPKGIYEIKTIYINE